MKKIAGNLIFIIMTCLIGGLVFLYFYKMGIQIYGSDVYDHFFKTDYLINEIQKGNYFPSYTPLQFNGLEVFRYATPFPYGILGLLKYQFGNWEMTYALFLLTCYGIAMLGWMAFGHHLNRRVCAFVLGCVYCCLPEIQRMCRYEGNLPRILATAFVPIALYFFYRVLAERKKSSLIGFTFFHILMFASDMTTCGQFMLATLLFIVIYSVVNHQYRFGIVLLLNECITMLCCGYFLIYSLIFGTTAVTQKANAEKLELFAEKLRDCISPFRINRDPNAFYFGISVFFILILAFIVMERQNASDILIVFLCLFSTTRTMLPVIRLLPQSQLFWMQQLIPIALCFFIIALLHWQKLRNIVLCLFVILLITDCSYTMYVGMNTIKSSETMQVQKELLKEAADITDNRVAILDKGEWNSFPSFYLNSQKNVSCGNGFNAQGAATGKQMNSVMDAFCGGFFTYAFDRLLYMGNDTVIVKNSLVAAEDTKAMIHAAEQVGYKLVKENDDAMLFHVNTKCPFGMTSEYHYLAIGANAESICYIYPQFAYGSSNALEDYSIDELEKYDILYLSGFTYENKDVVENKLKKVAESGTKIYIDMQHIPINKLIGKQEFLSVYAQPVSFHVKFPILEMKNGSQFKLDFKTPGYKEWKTSYMSGLQHVMKATNYDANTKLAYLGYQDNENIIFMGFNPVYYYTEVRSYDLLLYLNEVFELKNNLLPDRKLVPFTITYTKDGIEVQSDAEKLNIGVAVTDNLVPDREVGMDEKMFLVNKGTTKFRFTRKYATEGIVTSAVGTLLLFAYWIFLYVNLDGRRRENNV